MTGRPRLLVIGARGFLGGHLMASQDPRFDFIGAGRTGCEIPLDISKSELDRRLKVFGGNYFGVAPSIRLHGVEFRAVMQPQAVAEIETLGRN